LLKGEKKTNTGHHRNQGRENHQELKNTAHDTREKKIQIRGDYHPTTNLGAGQKGASAEKGGAHWGLNAGRLKADCEPQTCGRIEAIPKGVKVV